MTFPGSRRAFSLVEVVLALGIVAFCLLALLGLLPAGLNSLRNAREEAAAASVLAQISDSIRLAPSGSNGVATALGAYSDLRWTNNGPVVKWDFSHLSLGGIVLSNGSDVQAAARLKARVELTPPKVTPADVIPGFAFVSVAWPPQAEWAGGSSNRWIKSQGFLEAQVIFLPRE